MRRRDNRRRFTRRVTENEHRINEHIRVPEIRLVGDNLEEVSKVAGEKVESGIYQTRKVKAWAETMELDLVEISPKAKPPVCKIINYKKFLYERKRREKDLKAKQVKVVVKEIRFGPNTDDHDFQFKLKHAQRFLEEGAKVKAYVQFKGRSIIFKDRGEVLLKKFIAELAEYGEPEFRLKMEDRRMHCTIAPKKTPKKKDKDNKKAKGKDKPENKG
ncbi:MAG: translation initiation factor IF-3 [Aureispira sp.]|nr:translation initiation factor IF-3 [Aureispira sp.]